VGTAVADVRRSKALAVVLQAATVTDASGNPIDLSSLDASEIDEVEDAVEDMLAEEELEDEFEEELEEELEEADAEQK